MKRIFFSFLLLCNSLLLFSQEKQIQGIVFDADSKQRLTRVYIYNTSTHKGFYNNSKGEFTTTASTGDILVAALQGYGVDTIRVKTVSTILFHLKRSSILLKEVIIRDSTLNPKNRLSKNQQDYKDIYRKGDATDILNINSRGVGLGIDALWSLLSREGKNARFLQKIIERDYKEHLISYRYKSTLVQNITGLTGEKLRDFMEQYRPSYNFIIEANDYALIEFVRNSFQRYQQNPGTNRLPPLIRVSRE